MKPVLIKNQEVEDQPAIKKTDEFGATKIRLIDRVTARNTSKLSQLQDEDFLTGWETLDTLGVKPKDLVEQNSGLPMTNGDQ